MGVRCKRVDVRDMELGGMLRAFCLKRCAACV